MAINKERLTEVLDAYDGDTKRAALALKIDHLEVQELVTRLGLDLEPMNQRLKEKLEQNKIRDIKDKNYDLVLAYVYRQLPRILDEVTTASIFERIKSEGLDLISFVKKVDDHDPITNHDFLINQCKVCIYSNIVDVYCKKELRQQTPSIKWDEKVNSFCKNLQPEILVFNKHFTIKYSDLLESYVFFNSDVSHSIKGKSLLKILADILSVPVDQNLFLYYLAIKNTADSEKVREIWAFSKMMNMVKTGKILQNS